MMCCRRGKLEKVEKELRAYKSSLNALSLSGPMGASESRPSLNNE